MSDTAAYPTIPRLMPRIQRPGIGPAVALIEGELDIGLVMTGPGGAIPVDRAQLDHWGVSFEDALVRAMSNMRSMSGPIGWQDVHTVPGMLSYINHDGVAASRMLLLPELLKSWPIEGVLVAVPTADQLLCVPLDRVESMEAFRVLVLAGQAAQRLGGHPLSDQVYWFDGLTWHHIHVTHRAEDVEVDPPVGFIAALERLTAYNMMPVAAEA